jgi:AraC-like DNA-binding protein
MLNASNEDFDGAMPYLPERRPGRQHEFFDPAFGVDNRGDQTATGGLPQAPDMGLYTLDQGSNEAPAHRYPRPLDLSNAGGTWRAILAIGVDSRFGTHLSQSFFEGRQDHLRLADLLLQRHGGIMKLSFFRPRQELAPYIESLWVFESEVGLLAAENTSAAPNGCSKLTFAYGDSFVSTANGKATVRPERRLHFVGNRDSAIHIQSAVKRIGCIGVEFYPFGAYPIFGIPMGETFNFIGDAEMVLGEWARTVQEGLNYLEGVEQRMGFLQDQLVLSLRRNRVRTVSRPHEVVAYCVSFLKSTDGRSAIRELEFKTGYSRRYLDLLFKEHVGLPPKTLAGIFRFQRFNRKWAEGQSFDLLKDDLNEYYYDQSHFTREFKKMTGHTPGKYIHEISNEFGRQISRR